MTLLAGATAAIVALTVAGVFVTRPARTILPLYAGMIPVGSIVKLPVPLPAPFNSLSSVLGAVAIAALVGHVIVFRRARIPSLPVAAWMAFFAWAMLTTFWAVDWRAAIDLLFVALPLVVMMIVIGITRTDAGDLDALRLAIVLGGIIVGVYATVLLMTGSALPIHGTTERFSVASSSDQTNPNQLAATLLLPLILSVDLIITGGPWWGRSVIWRISGAIGAVTMIIAIIMSGSRGGALAAGIGLLLTLWLWWRRVPEARPSIKRLVATTLLFLLVVSATLFVSARVFPEGRVATIMRGDAVQRLVNLETGSSGRSEIWGTGLLACERHCGWGGGLDSFPIIFDQIFPFSAAAKNVGQDRPAHNVYLELAVETGFLGLTLFGLALLAEWRTLRTREMKGVSPSVSAALIALLTTNVFEGQIWFKYFWILFVLIRVAEGAAAAPQQKAFSTDFFHAFARMRRGTGREILS
jgi:O-antigen ligase